MDISVRTQNLFIFISLVKLIHSHRKYSRKNFFRWKFPKCDAQVIRPPWVNVIIINMNYGKKKYNLWALIWTHLLYARYISLRVWDETTLKQTTLVTRHRHCQPRGYSNASPSSCLKPWRRWWTSLADGLSFGSLFQQFSTSFQCVSLIQVSEGRAGLTSVKSFNTTDASLSKWYGMFPDSVLRCTGCGGQIPDVDKIQILPVRLYNPLNINRMLDFQRVHKTDPQFVGALGPSIWLPLELPNLQRLQLML